jgi:hypothetical protein
VIEHLTKKLNYLNLNSIKSGGVYDNYKNLDIASMDVAPQVKYKHVKYRYIDVNMPYPRLDG